MMANDFKFQISDFKFQIDPQASLARSVAVRQLAPPGRMQFSFCNAFNAARREAHSCR